MPEDEYAIEIAIKVARKLIATEHISPKKIVGLGYALYALERFPAVSYGVDCEFGIKYEYGTDEYKEMKYYIFRISSDCFEISVGGSVYDKGVGSDSISEPGWLIQSNGVSNRDVELWSLEDDITDLIKMGAEVTVEYESNIVFD